MQKQMTPRQLRQEIENIDQRLAQLVPWEKKLTAIRKQYVLQADRYVVALIERGIQPGQGRPTELALDEFDRGWPGLYETRDTIAELKERRELLVEQQPTKAQTAERIREAEARASDIRSRSAVLTPRLATLEATLNEVAQLALTVAQDTWLLWEASTTLDRMTAEADIARPETPRVQAPSVPLAAQLGVLLQACFHGGQPTRLDQTVVESSFARLATSTPAVEVHRE